jgi:geranylgeranylglycerol-phosphate geranylgeranyltransferase
LALAFGNVINDIFDIETDRVSHPNRPLVTGAVSKKEATIYSFILGILSIIMGFLVSSVHGYATIIPIIILILYAVKLKGTPFSGNVVVSLLVAYTLIFGALGGVIETVIIPAILAFLANFNREIVKDLADIDGDSKVGLKTTATIPKVIVNIVLAISTVLFLVVAPIPYFRETLQGGYGIITFFMVIPLSVLSVITYIKKRLALTSLILKIEMFLGLVALLASKI